MLFFPPTRFERRAERNHREGRAKAICATCPTASIRPVNISFDDDVRPERFDASIGECKRREGV